MTSDVLVVGAGIIGCAVAFELAERGLSVTVVDDRLPGMGATQASAGVLAPYIEARDGGPLVQLTARSLGMYDKFVDGVQGAIHRAILYRRTGTLDVALTSDGMARLSAASRQLTADGIAATLLDAKAVAAELPDLSPNALGGLFIPDHGFVGVGELTRALADAATRRGVTFIRSARVSRISNGEDDVVAENDGSRWHARHVVLAAGSWAGQIDLLKSPPVPIRPVRGQLVQLSWQGTRLPRVIWGERCYIVPWDDGTVLVGATVEDVGFDERTTAAGVSELLNAACEIIPHAAAAAFSGARGGLRPASTDHLPVIGASTSVPGLIYAAGHYRNGVLLAPLTAALVANLILDEGSDPMLALTDPGRFGLL